MAGEMSASEGHQNDLADKDFRTVIEDARARHAAVLSLMYAMDGQGMSLLRIYATIAVATAAGAAAGLSNPSTFSHSLTGALMVATIVLCSGSYFCLAALWPSRINLPGRNADFWQWALLPDVSRADVLNAYLAKLSDKGKANTAINQKAARNLERAKYCAIVTPLAMLVTILVAYVCSV